jgi:hypothetical protein
MPYSKACNNAHPRSRTALSLSSGPIEGILLLLNRTGIFAHAHLPLVLSQQTTKILRKHEHHGNGRVTLDKVLQIGGLLSRAALCRSHHHERNASGRRRLVQDDRLFGDGTGSLPDEKGEAASQAYTATPCIPERQFPRPTGRRCGTPGSIAKKDEEMSVF